MSSRRLTRALASLLLVLLAGPAGAGPILYINDAFGRIGTVDVATGASTSIGLAGVQLTDIAFSPSGQLFGAGYSSLYSLSTTTGAATLIGDFGVSTINALAFRPDGALFAAGGTTLYSVNPATGAATATGAIPASSAGDLEFYSGSLYMSTTTNILYRINDVQNPVNGVFEGPFGFSSVLGLAAGDDGVLYGVAGTQVFSINVGNGAGTLRANYSGGLLSNAQGATALVPAPSAGLLLATAVAGVFGHRIRQRRRLGHTQQV